MSTVNVVGTVRATAYDSYFSCNTAAGACGLVLPAITVVADGWTITVVDAQANAATNNITIATPDGALINGLSSLVISLSGGAATLVKNGSSWSAAGEFTPVGPGVVNVAPYWSVQAATSSAVTVLAGTTYLACNFAGTCAVTLPLPTATGVVLGRPLFVQNQQNTGNTTTVYVRLVGNNASCSVNGTNADITISTALGGLRLVPTTTGWWQF